MSRDIKQIINERCAEEEAKSQPSRSHTYEFGGKRRQLTVISLPLDLVMLNHNNHRLTAQLSVYSDVLGNPTSSESQAKLQETLAQTEKFQALKNELHDDGQVQPGLITRDGLLVDGNTRCAALRELKKEGRITHNTIDVAVLDSSVTASEIADIEVGIQMVRYTHQDYTFTNSLLFMKQYKDRGKNNKEIAKAWKWRSEAKVAKHMRILEIIEEIRALRNPPIPYSFFDKKEQIFLDLDDAVQLLEKDGRVNEAQALKEQRVMGMFFGLNKDKIRTIAADFIEEASDYLPNDGKAKRLIKENTKKPIFDPDFDDEEVKEEINTTAILTEIINQSDLIKNGDLNPEFESDFFDELSTAFKTEAERQDNDKRRKHRNEELHITMKSIRADIGKVRSNLSDRVGQDGFKEGPLRQSIRHVMKELNQLNEEFEKLSSRKSN